jgi:hypothetical protein
MCKWCLGNIRQNPYYFHLYVPVVKVATVPCASASETTFGALDVRPAANSSHGFRMEPYL